MKNGGFRDRILFPLVIPVVVLVGMGFFVANLSRVLLAVNKDLSVVIAIGVAVVIMLGASWAATRKRIARSTLVSLVVLLALAVGSSGAIAARHGERKAEKHEVIGGESAAPTPNPPGASPSQIPSSAPPAPPGGTTTVKVADPASFDPQSISISAGTAVTWNWTGSIPHTVSSAAGAGVSFDSGTKSGNGASFTFTFAKAGTYKYYCKFHGTPDGTQGMVGTVVVT